MPTAALPAEESPQTQINNIYAMMWPSATTADADLFMQDGEWTSFLPELDGPDGLEAGMDQIL
jgi:transcriptional regulatory protein GAL4